MKNVDKGVEGRQESRCQGHSCALHMVGLPEEEVWGLLAAGWGPWEVPRGCPRRPHSLDP